MEELPVESKDSSAKEVVTGNGEGQSGVQTIQVKLCGCICSLCLKKRIDLRVKIILIF